MCAKVRNYIIRKFLSINITIYIKQWIAFTWDISGYDNHPFEHNNTGTKGNYRCTPFSPWMSAIWVNGRNVVDFSLTVDTTLERHVNKSQFKPNIYFIVFPNYTNAKSKWFVKISSELDIQFVDRT